MFYGHMLFVNKHVLRLHIAMNYFFGMKITQPLHIRSYVMSNLGLLKIENLSVFSIPFSNIKGKSNKSFEGQLLVSIL